MDPAASWGEVCNQTSTALGVTSTIISCPSSSFLGLMIFAVVWIFPTAFGSADDVCGGCIELADCNAWFHEEAEDDSFREDDIE